MDNLEKFIHDNRLDFDAEVPQLKLWVGIENRLDDNSIEQFTQSNRADFDTETPNLKIWAAIDKQLNPTLAPKLGVQQWVWRIAASLTLLVVGASAGFYFKTTNEAATLAQTVNQIAPDFREAEQFYAQKVNTQLVKLATYSPNSDPSVLADLTQIDEMEKELKKELDEAPNATREEIVKRMIDNYKIKLGILERVLQHLDTHQNNNSTKGQDNKI